MELLTPAIALVLGLVCGAAACWLMLRGRSTDGRVLAAQARLEAANARVEAADSRREAATARARNDTEIERARADVAQAKVDAADAKAAAARAQAQVSALEAEVSKSEALRDGAIARAAELAADRESAVNQFKVLSAEVMTAQGKAADVSAEQRLKATEQLMAPVRASLERFESRLTEVEKERAAMSAELKQQVLGVQLTGEQLRQETAKLTTALRKPHVRGSWGEVQLRRVVELAGMVEHCDFTEQATSSTDDRTIRPDLKVALSAEKFVYVDSKVPLSGFLDAQDAPDDESRRKALGSFARNVKGHVDSLSAKQYWKADEQGATPEFVVMFMPSEALFAEALAQLPDLQEHAAGRGIILTTPSTLIGLLRSIAFGWKQAALADSAREISELGRTLYDRLGTMGTHIDKLGRAIRTSATAYNDAVGALESRVLVSARRFRDLHVATDELAEPAQVVVAVRTLTAPELVEDAAGVEPIVGRQSRRSLTGAAAEADLLVRESPGVDELTSSDAGRRPASTQGRWGHVARG